MYKSVVFENLEIIIDPETKSDDANSGEDILKLIRKIHENLEESPNIISQFIKSCARNADFSNILGVEILKKKHIEKIKNISVEKLLQSQIKDLTDKTISLTKIQWILEWDACEFLTRPLIIHYGP